MQLTNSQHPTTCGRLGRPLGNKVEIAVQRLVLCALKDLAHLRHLWIQNNYVLITYAMNENISALLQQTASLPLSQIQLSQIPGSQVAQVAADARTVLLQSDIQEVCNGVIEALTEEKGVKALKVLLHACRTEDAGNSADAARLCSLRSELCSRLAAAVHAMPQPEQAKAALLPLQLELMHLQRQDCRQLLQSCMVAVEEGRPHWADLLQLLPGCICRLMAADATTFTAAAEHSTQDADDVGDRAAHRDAALHRLLQCSWQPQQVVTLLLVLKDVPMTQEQLLLVMHKALKACRSGELRDVPSIIHHVLLLSAAGARSMALRGVCALMDSLSRMPQHTASGGTGPSTTLLQLQGTVLIHISTLLKYDAGLGTEWLKHLKGGGLTSSPFLLQVVATMCKQQKFEVPLLQLVKKALLQGYEQQQRGRSPWLPALGSSGAPGAAGSSTINGAAATSTTSVKGGQLAAGLLRAIQMSVHASELVVPAVLKLAQQLMGAPLKSPLHLVIACQPNGKLPPMAAPATCACFLGMQLLGEVFEDHSEARSEVLKLCNEHLQYSKPEAALPFILLFGNICRAQPALLCQHLPQLKECLVQLPALGSDDAALALLLALWPLCRLHSDLQGHVVLLLRKALINREVACRLVAVKGFIHLVLRQLHGGSPVLVPDSGPSFSQASSSQASLSQVAALSGGMEGLNLLQEFSGVLRRALTQQAPVRAALYEGLLQVLAADPNALEVLCDLLLPHVAQLVEPDQDQDQDQGLPLKLHLCAAVQQGRAQLVEPLPALVACVRRLAVLQGPVGVGSDGLLDGSSLSDLPGRLAAGDSAAAMKACFAGLRDRLLQCEVEQFALDRSADWSLFTAEGMLTHLHAANLLGVLEVLLEDIVLDCAALQPDAPAQAAEKLVQQFAAAFALHSRVYSLAATAGSSSGKKEAGGAAEGHAGKRPRPSSDYVPVESRTPQMSPACLGALCKAILDDRLLPNWQEQPGQGAAAPAQQGSPRAGPTSSGTHSNSSSQPGQSVDGSCDQQQQRLVRDAKFRAFVLRSCVGYLAAARQGATQALLVAGATGEGGNDWQLLAPGLFETAKVILLTCSSGGRAVITANSNKGGVAGSKAAASSSETLEQLAANALWQLLSLADETLQLEQLFELLPVPASSVPGAEQQQAEGEAAAAASSSSLVRAVGPRLVYLQDCVGRLMQQTCFKEAQVLAEALLLLGKQLVAAHPGGVPPAVAALSSWARSCCDQVTPQVTLCALVKVLLELWVRFQGKGDLDALALVAADIQFVIGDATKDTQQSQAHGQQLPILNIDKTAQPSTAMVLAYMTEALTELEELVSGLLKASTGNTELDAGLAGTGGSSSTTNSSQQIKVLSAAACQRAVKLVGILSTLVNTIFAMNSVVEGLTRLLTQAYRCLVVSAKLHTPAKLTKAAAAAAAAGSGTSSSAQAGGPGLTPEFKALVAAVHRDVTPPLYSFLQDTQDMEGRVTGKMALARVKKDAKTIPQLVFQVEDWEKQLVLAGRRGKVNLMAEAKRSVARDFKLELPQGATQPANARYSQRRGSQGKGAAAAAAAGEQHPDGEMEVSDAEGDPGSAGQGSLPDDMEEEEEVVDMVQDESEAEEEPEQEAAQPAHKLHAKQPAAAAQAGMKAAAAGQQKPRPKALGMSRRPPLHPVHNK